MGGEKDLLVLAASAWTELTEYRYSFTYGYRKQLYTICLSFSAQDFPHLAGFQYLKDIQLPKFNPPKAVEMILSGKIKYDTVQKSAQFDNLVKPRLLALVHLKDTLENDFGLYSFMPRFYPFTELPIWLYDHFVPVQLHVALLRTAVHSSGSKRSRWFKNPKNEPPIRHPGKEPRGSAISV